jgi:diguanylate cyclase (GGDEF)-like protein
MANSATLSFSKTGRGLFTAEEVRQLMQVEFERARRYGYAIACLTIQVDRLEHLETVHGLETKSAILNAIADLVKSATRAGDLLGYLVQDRLVVVVPHTTGEAARALGERLLTGARKLRFASESRTLRVTLSIGVAHNQNPDATSFPVLEEVSDEGRAVADSSGGDRVSETELYRLHQAKHEVPVNGYRGRLEALVDERGDFESAVAQITEEIVERAIREAREEWANAQPTADDKRAAEQQRSAEKDQAEDEAETYKRQVELLQRRLAKLTESLGLTEQELARVRRMKAVDSGIESVYREVQGLTGDGERGEMKRELMSQIFAANLDLKQRKRPA